MLSQDFNSLLGDLLTQVKLQRTEAESLRQQLNISRELALQSNLAASKSFQDILLEEQSQAAIDRQNLLAVVSNLIMAQGEAQETRINGKINEIQNDIMLSQEKFNDSSNMYEQGMKSWSQQEEKLIEEISRSQETIDLKMKENWTVSKNQFINFIAKTFFH